MPSFRLVHVTGEDLRAHRSFRLVHVTGEDLRAHRFAVPDWKGGGMIPLGGWHAPGR